jgi:hypothetical protein
MEGRADAGHEHLEGREKRIRRGHFLRQAANEDRGPVEFGVIKDVDVEHRILRTRQVLAQTEFSGILEGDGGVLRR